MKRFFKWGLLGVAGLLGVWTVWNLWATNKLERAVAELEERGLATTLADLERGLPPFDTKPADRENAAPVLEAAFALAKSVEPPEWDLGDFPWDVAEGAEIPEEVQKGLPRFDKVFELLYEAAERPRCRFDLRWRDGYAVVMSHLQEIRDSGRLLATRAIARSESGDTDGAIDDVRVLFALSRSLREEPTLISQLVRIAVAGGGLDVLKVILPRASSAASVLEETEPEAAIGSIGRGFQGELAMVLAIATDPDAWADLATGGDLRGLASPFSSLARPYLKADVAFVADLLGRCIVAARKPYPAALELVEAVDKDARDGGVITKLLMPSITSTVQSEARHASRVELTWLAARCIDYRREHGRYPEKLGDLKDVKPDPLTGRPYVLERRGDELVLRSEASEAEGDHGGAIEWVLKE